MTIDNIVTDLRDCARCGEGHQALTFERLLRPVEGRHGTDALTHWAMCPVSKQPILLGQGVAG